MISKGYSLFELLIVLAILVIVVSLVSVDISSIFTKNNLTIVSKELSTDLNYAKQKAIEESNNWIIYFNDTSYEIYSELNPAEILVKKDYSDKQVYFGDSGGNYSPVNNVVEFNSNGGLALNSIEIIGMHNKDNESIYIVINSSTGRVTIQNTNP